MVFECLLAAMIGNFEFEKNGKREVVVRGAHSETSRGHSCFGWGDVSGVNFHLFCEYLLLSMGGGRIEEWNHVRSLDTSCAITCLV